MLCSKPGLHQILCVPQFNSQLPPCVYFCIAASYFTNTYKFPLLTTQHTDLSELHRVSSGMTIQPPGASVHLTTSHCAPTLLSYKDLNCRLLWTITWKTLRKYGKKVGENIQGISEKCKVFSVYFREYCIYGGYSSFWDSPAYILCHL